MKLSIETCVEALASAAINRKHALQLELAVGLAVFLMHGSTSKEGRAMLVDAYAAAGYRCVHISEMDYKTVNRRINATAALFEKLPVATWVGKHNDTLALKCICQGLEPYELYTISDVQRYALPAPKAASKAPVAVAPALDIVEGPRTGQDKIIQQFRRAADQWKHVNTLHLSVPIPDDTPRDEIIELAMQLLSIAKKELLTA